MQIPAQIRWFIERALVPGAALLPAHYPTEETFPGFQSGFRFHGLTKTDLTGTRDGEWQPGWHVVALNQLDDPFFVDFAEADAGYPIYYAAHGAGQWRPLRIAENVEEFAKLLEQLIARQKDGKAWADLLATTTDLSHEYWKEVYAECGKSGDTEREDEPSARWNANDWTAGSLIMTDGGPQKLKVAQLVGKALGLSPKEALALCRGKEVSVATGYRKFLQSQLEKLIALGATVEFRPGPD